MNDTALPNGLRMDTLRSAYQSGRFSPRQVLLALRARADRRNTV
ncbi:hypothetical protein [Pseudomonas syringae group genomosp. 7]